MDKLKKLEWINKEFVHELEFREKIFFESESTFKEFSQIKAKYTSDVQSLEIQLQQMKLQIQQANHDNSNQCLSGQEKEQVKSLHELQSKEKLLIAELKSKEEQFKAYEKSCENKRNQLQREHVKIVNELSNRMKEMENATSFTVKQLQEERSDIHRELEKCLKEYHSRETILKSQVTSLEQDMEMQQSLKKILSTQIEDLTAKLRDAQEKEEAFKETIEKADQIVSDVEKGYRERIAVLEDNNRILQKRIQSLEEELEEVNSKLDDKSFTSDPFSDEVHLRETIVRLEESEHSLRNKIRLLESERNELLIELQENEQVINKNVHLQKEYDSLKREFSVLKSNKQDLEDIIRTTTESFAVKETDMKRVIQGLKRDRDDLEDSLNDLKKHRSLSCPSPTSSCYQTSPLKDFS